MTGKPSQSLGSVPPTFPRIRFAMPGPDADWDAFRLQLKAWAGTGKTALTFVKAAEVGLQTQNKTSINNPNLSQEKIQDLLRKYAEQDRGKEAVSDLLLSVSDYVVQDSTGFDAQRLEQFAAPGVVETFGAYNHRDEGARARVNFPLCVLPWREDALSAPSTLCVVDAR